MKLASIGLSAAVVALLAAGGYILKNITASRAEPGGGGAAVPNAPRAKRLKEQGATPEGRAAVVEGANHFAFDMYAQLKDNPGNVFFSPWSIESVLAIAYEGARGQTAAEMAAAAHLPADAAGRRGSFAALHNAFNPEGSAYSLTVSNAVWLAHGYPMESDYKRVVEDFYGGGVTQLDFASQPQQACDRINAWVAAKTNNLIPLIVSSESVTPNTRLVLTNAIYFKGQWIHGFDEALTAPEPFWTEPGKSVDAQFMRLADSSAELQYAETGDWQAVQLPYKGGELSMLVVLPKPGKAAEDIETSLDSTTWSAMVQSLFAPRNVVVQLPRFKFETTYQLGDPLSAMGMRVAFTDGVADFSGIAPTGLSIASVIHKAVVEVNEEGTEAAAVTAMMMTDSAPSEDQPPLFRTDRPFLFAIKHNATGAILFLGRVADPTK